MWFVFPLSLVKHYLSWWQPPNKSSSYKGTLLNSFDIALLNWNTKHSAEPYPGKTLEISHYHSEEQHMDSCKWTLLHKSDVQNKVANDTCHLFSTKRYLEIKGEWEKESDVKDTFPEDGLQWVVVPGEEQIQLTQAVILHTNNSCNVATIYAIPDMFKTLNSWSWEEEHQQHLSSKLGLWDRKAFIWGLKRWQQLLRWVVNGLRQ